MRRPASSVTPSARQRSVRLRDVKESDLKIFYEHQRDPEAYQMARFPSREEDAFMVHWHKIMGDEAVTLKTILFHGQVAGNIVSFLHGDAREIGYWIGREFWGKGIATEALSRFLRQVKTRPLYAGVAKQNVASIRVLEKCGFAISGKNGEELTLKLE